MADSEGLSKSAKKNQRRRAKKNADSEPSAAAGPSCTQQEIPTKPEQLIPLLKEQLDKAKADKDHKKANKLREQIWVLTDMAKGVRTDLKREDLEEILDSIPSSVSHLATPADPPAEPQPTTTSVGTDKEVKKIQKKLDQIHKLKERQSKGEKLEPNQLEKINTEAELRQEMEIIEQALRENLKL